MRLLSEIAAFLWAVINNWAGYSTGGILVALIAFWQVLRQRTISKRFGIGVATLFMLMALFTAWDEQYKQVNKIADENKVLSTKNETLSNQVNTLTNQLVAKDRPLIIQMASDPGISHLIKRQQAELEKLKSQMPSPKKKALQLSNDMITFSADMIKNSPTAPIIRTKTREEYDAQMDQFTRSDIQWMNAMGAEYQRQFAVRIAVLEDDLKTAGLSHDLELCQYSNGNTFAIQRCAAIVGEMADKLPQ